MKGFVSIRTEEDFDRRFPDEASCEEYLFHMKWPNGPVCPACGHLGCTDLSTRAEYQCQRAGCGKQTSLIAGTVMQDTKLKLRQWFRAIFYVCESMNSITGKAIARRLGVSDPTGWYLLHRIRKALGLPLNKIAMDGRVLINQSSFEDAVTTLAWTEAGLQDGPVVAVLVDRLIGSDTALFPEIDTEHSPAPEPGPKLESDPVSDPGPGPGLGTRGGLEGEPKPVRKRRRGMRHAHNRDQSWVHFRVIDPVEGSDIDTIITDHVATETDIVFMDERLAPGVAAPLDRSRGGSDHTIGGKKVRVVGEDDGDAGAVARIVHEVKRWFTEVFRGSVGRHLQAYLDEYAFRYNRWGVQAFLFGMVVGRVVTTKPITYKELTNYQSWLARHRAGNARPDPATLQCAAA